MAYQYEIPEGFRLASDGKLWLLGDTFFTDAWKMGTELKPRFQDYKYIYCLARGGYPIGSVVGNCFGRNDIPSLMVKSYDGEKSGDLIIMSDIPPDLLKDEGKGALILDDLLDTGGTARNLKKMLPKAFFAAVYAKPSGEMVADFFLRKIPDTWVVFPWEDSMANFVPAV